MQAQQRRSSGESSQSRSSGASYQFLLDEISRSLSASGAGSRQDNITSAFSADASVEQLRYAISEAKEQHLQLLQSLEAIPPALQGAYGPLAEPASTNSASGGVDSNLAVLTTKQQRRLTAIAEETSSCMISPVGSGGQQFHALLASASSVPTSMVQSGTATPSTYTPWMSGLSTATATVPATATNELKSDSLYTYPIRSMSCTTDSGAAATPAGTFKAAQCSCSEAGAGAVSMDSSRGQIIVSTPQNTISHEMAAFLQDEDPVDSWVTTHCQSASAPLACTSRLSSNENLAWNSHNTSNNSSSSGAVQQTSAHDAPDYSVQIQHTVCSALGAVAADADAADLQHLRYANTDEAGAWSEAHVVDGSAYVDDAAATTRCSSRTSAATSSRRPSSGVDYEPSVSWQACRRNSSAIWSQRENLQQECTSPNLQLQQHMSTDSAAYGSVPETPDAFSGEQQQQQMAPWSDCGQHHQQEQELQCDADATLQVVAPQQRRWLQQQSFQQWQHGSGSHEQPQQQQHKQEQQLQREAGMDQQQQQQWEPQQSSRQGKHGSDWQQQEQQLMLGQDLQWASGGGHQQRQWQQQQSFQQWQQHSLQDSSEEERQQQWQRQDSMQHQPGVCAPSLVNSTGSSNQALLAALNPLEFVLWQQRQHQRTLLERALHALTSLQADVDSLLVARQNSVAVCADAQESLVGRSSSQQTLQQQQLNQLESQGSQQDGLVGMQRHTQEVQQVLSIAREAPPQQLQQGDEIPSKHSLEQRLSLYEPQHQQQLQHPVAKANGLDADWVGSDNESINHNDDWSIPAARAGANITTLPSLMPYQQVHLEQGSAKAVCSNAIAGHATCSLAGGDCPKGISFSCGGTASQAGGVNAQQPDVLPRSLSSAARQPVQHGSATDDDNNVDSFEAELLQLEAAAPGRRLSEETLMHYYAANGWSENGADQKETQVQSQGGSQQEVSADTAQTAYQLLDNMQVIPANKSFSSWQQQLQLEPQQHEQDAGIDDFEAQLLAMEAAEPGRRLSDTAAAERCVLFAAAAPANSSEITAIDEATVVPDSNTLALKNEPIANNTDNLADQKAEAFEAELFEEECGGPTGVTVCCSEEDCADGTAPAATAEQKSAERVENTVHNTDTAVRHCTVTFNLPEEVQSIRSSSEDVDIEQLAKEETPIPDYHSRQQDTDSSSQADASGAVVQEVPASILDPSCIEATQTALDDDFEAELLKLEQGAAAAAGVQLQIDSSSDIGNDSGADSHAEEAGEGANLYVQAATAAAYAQSTISTAISIKSSAPNDDLANLEVVCPSNDASGDLESTAVMQVDLQILHQATTTSDDLSVLNSSPEVQPLVCDAQYGCQVQEQQRTQYHWFEDEQCFMDECGDQQDEQLVSTEACCVPQPTSHIAACLAPDECNIASNVEGSSQQNDECSVPGFANSSSSSQTVDTSPTTETEQAAYGELAVQMTAQLNTEHPTQQQQGDTISTAQRVLEDVPAPNIGQQCQLQTHVQLAHCIDHVGNLGTETAVQGTPPPDQQQSMQQSPEHLQVDELWSLLQQLEQQHGEGVQQMFGESQLTELQRLLQQYEQQHQQQQDGSGSPAAPTAGWLAVLREQIALLVGSASGQASAAPMSSSSGCLTVTSNQQGQAVPMALSLSALIDQITSMLSGSSDQAVKGLYSGDGTNGRLVSSTTEGTEVSAVQSPAAVAEVPINNPECAESYTSSLQRSNSGAVGSEACHMTAISGLAMRQTPGPADKISPPSPEGGTSHLLTATASAATLQAAPMDGGAGLATPGLAFTAEAAAASSATFAQHANTGLKGPATAQHAIQADCCTSTDITLQQQQQGWSVSMTASQPQLDEQQAVQNANSAACSHTFAPTAVNIAGTSHQLQIGNADGIGCFTFQLSASPMIADCGGIGYSNTCGLGFGQLQTAANPSHQQELQVQPARQHDECALDCNSTPSSRSRDNQHQTCVSAEIADAEIAPVVQQPQLAGCGTAQTSGPNASAVGAHSNKHVQQYADSTCTALNIGQASECVSSLSFANSSISLAHSSFISLPEENSSSSSMLPADAFAMSFFGNEQVQLQPDVVAKSGEVPGATVHAATPALLHTESIDAGLNFEQQHTSRIQIARSSNSSCRSSSSSSNSCSSVNVCNSSSSLCTGLTSIDAALAAENSCSEHCTQTQRYRCGCNGQHCSSPAAPTVNNSSSLNVALDSVGGNISPGRPISQKTNVSAPDDTMPQQNLSHRRLAKKLAQIDSKVQQIELQVQKDIIEEEKLERQLKWQQQLMQQQKQQQEFAWQQQQQWDDHACSCVPAGQPYKLVTDVGDCWDRAAAYEYNSQPARYGANGRPWSAADHPGQDTYQATKQPMAISSCKYEGSCTTNSGTNDGFWRTVGLRHQRHADPYCNHVHRCSRQQCNCHGQLYGMSVESWVVPPEPWGLAEINSHSYVTLQPPRTPDVAENPLAVTASIPRVMAEPYSGCNRTTRWSAVGNASLQTLSMSRSVNSMGRPGSAPAVAAGSFRRNAFSAAGSFDVSKAATAAALSGHGSSLWSEVIRECQTEMLGQALLLSESAGVCAEAKVLTAALRASWDVLHG